MAGERPFGAARPDLLLEIHISPLGAYATAVVAYTLQAKASVPPLGRELTPVEIRIGWAYALPGSSKQENRRHLIRFQPQRFGSRLIRHGCQTGTGACQPWLALENQAILLGCQTRPSSNATLSLLKNRAIRLGCQTYIGERSRGHADRRLGPSCRPIRAVCPFLTDSLHEIPAQRPESHRIDSKAWFRLPRATMPWFSRLLG